MDVKRGRGPDTIERPIEVTLTRQELLDVIAYFSKRKINAVVKFADLEAMTMEGGNTLEYIKFTGQETVQLNWAKSITVVAPDAPATPVTIPDTPTPPNA